jgi:hypothetical protein
MLASATRYICHSRLQGIRLNLSSETIQPRYPTTGVDGKSRSISKEWRGKVDGFRRNALEAGRLKTRPDQRVARLPRHKTLRSSICQALFRSRVNLVSLSSSAPQPGIIRYWCAVLSIEKAVVMQGVAMAHTEN